MSCFIIDSSFGWKANIGKSKDLLSRNCSTTVSITTVVGTRSVTWNARIVNLQKSKGDFSYL